MPQQQPINRRELIERHNVKIKNAEPFGSLSVGNGRFAMTVDATGLQTFHEFHEKAVPIGTQSDWGWHAFANPEKLTLDDVKQEYDFFGRKVPYFDGGRKEKDTRGSRAYEWLRANPHRLDLGRIAISIRRDDGSEFEISDLKSIDQTLDLWRGVIESRFTVSGKAVHVTTAVHPEVDMIAVRVESELLSSGRATLQIKFPGPCADWRQSADWTNVDAHQTICRNRENGADFLRRLGSSGDDTKYFARASWPNNGVAKEVVHALSKHAFELKSRVNVCELVMAYSANPIEDELPAFGEVVRDCETYWKDFWSTGGAVDFSGSTDPRARELERRVVLSQYLTAINCAGNNPPQETGLTCNSWFGKFHLEMHWWHVAHFALWGRESLLQRSLGWYEKTIDVARDLAQKQGYDGVRWGKMTSPDARESPSPIATFLIWQQPHPIFLAELVYRKMHDRAVLEQYSNVVFETARFMASFAHWDEPNNRFVLGPPMIPAQESYGNTRRTNLNPTYELAYWHWALKIANEWKARLGLDRIESWDKVADHLAKPNIREGIYTAIETEPFTLYNDHPSHLMAYGWVAPTPLVDPKIMSATLDDVLKKWDWPSTWGWDYPVVAMCAARLGRPKDAVDALLVDTPKNKYSVNGHNYQRENLPLYLPGNGGLLYAIAMMARGWDGAPSVYAPGFPQDGSWKVRHEGLAPAV